MIGDQDLEVLIINTAAVLTTLPEKKAEWRGVIADAWERAGEMGAWHECVFLEVLLAWLDGKPAPPVSQANPYREAIERIRGMIQSGGVQAPPLPAEVLEPLNQLLASATWSEARRVLERHAGILLEEQVEEALDLLAESAVNDGKPELAENFAMHRDLLRLCRVRGIAEAFSEFGVEEERRAAMIELAVSGLGGSQAGRMALAAKVAEWLDAETDPAERGLLEVLQMAAFSRHPLAVKHQLEGEQAQVWEEIRARLEKENPAA